jgi:hypothetical protein
MKRNSLICTLLLTLTLGSFSGHAALITDNFDSYTAGTDIVTAGTPKGWLAGNGVISNAQSVSGPNSLYLGVANANAVAYGINNGTAIPTNDPRTWRFSYSTRLTATNSAAGFYIGSSFLIYTVSGKFQVDGVTSSVSTNSFAANTWYSVVVDFAPLANTYSLTISDGNSIFWSAAGAVQDGAFNTIQAKNMAYSVGGAYFDNVALAVIPEPASMVLLGAGAVFLAFRRCRRSSVSQ